MNKPKAGPAARLKTIRTAAGCSEKNIYDGSSCPAGCKIGGAFQETNFGFWMIAARCNVGRINVQFTPAPDKRSGAIFGGLGFGADYTHP